MVEADTTPTHPVTAAEQDVGHKPMGIGAEAAAVEPTVISHITVEHTVYVLIWSKIARHQRMATRRMQYGVIRCWAVRENAPERLGRSLLIKLMKKKLNNIIHLNYYVALL